MNVAQWTRGVLETFHDEWFTITQLHAEIESRSGETCKHKTLERAVFRMAASGVVESRWDESHPSVDGYIYGRLRRYRQERKEYRWHR